MRRESRRAAAQVDTALVAGLTQREEWLFVVGRAARPLRTLDLSREQARHPMVSLALGKFTSLFQSLDRARYVGLGEISARLAEDARVTLALAVALHD